MTIGCIQTPRAVGQKTEWERIKHTKVRTLRVEALPRLGQQDETYKQGFRVKGLGFRMMKGFDTPGEVG